MKKTEVEKKQQEKEDKEKGKESLVRDPSLATPKTNGV